ncbi:MAG: hypothetical protein KAR51_00900 [Candidatus Aenigmarchaeota archaeon]|nr:hypothetical protein [Candidatus Aenigmarchaeota archaeon]
MIEIIIFISFLIASITIVVSSIGLIKKQEDAQTEKPKLEEVLRKNLDDMTLEELKLKAEREVGKNYSKQLPKEYKLVDKIPEIEDREKGVKYVKGDNEFKDEIERYDLMRFISGERDTITDTPVEIFKKESLTPDEEKTVKMIFEDEEDSPKKEKKMNEYRQGMILKESLGDAGYNREMKKIETRDKEIYSKEIHAHEDTHASFDTTIIKKEIDLEKMSDDEQYEYITKTLFLPHDEQPSVKKNTIDEGLAYAINKYYGSDLTHDKNDFLSKAVYGDTTDLNNIDKIKDLCYQMIQLTGPDSTKRYVIGIVNEAYENEEDLILAVKDGIKEFLGSNELQGSLKYILAEINKHPSRKYKET